MIYGASLGAFVARCSALAIRIRSPFRDKRIALAGAKKRIAILLMPPILSACAAVTGYPAQPGSLPTTVTSLSGNALEALIAEYNSSTAAADRKKAIRNQIIYSDISQIDQSFNEFKRSLNSQQNILSIGTDFAALTLAGLGATVAGAGTKAALAAASAGVIGAKAAIDKDILYQKTITALVTEMEAQRSQVFARLITNMNSDAAKYPLEASSKDIQDYYQAGTLVNALEGVSQSAGAKAQEAAADVSRALTANYNYTSLSQKIEAFWMPDGRTVDKANEQRLQSCMTQNRVPGSIPFLINAGTEADKTAVISCLGP